MELERSRDIGYTRQPSPQLDRWECTYIKDDILVATKYCIWLKTTLLLQQVRKNIFMLEIMYFFHPTRILFPIFVTKSFFCTIICDKTYSTSRCKSSTFCSIYSKKNSADNQHWNHKTTVIIWPKKC